jgi:hypothetical protein
MLRKLVILDDPTPLVLRRQLQLMILNLIGYTSFRVLHHQSATERDLRQPWLTVFEAFDALETAPQDGTRVELLAVVDHRRQPPLWLPPAEAYTSPWMDQLPLAPKSRQLSALKALPTTYANCLRYVYPLLWIRVVGGWNLMQDRFMRRITSTRFQRTDGKLEAWSLLEYKPSWHVSHAKHPDHVAASDVHKQLVDYFAIRMLEYDELEVTWPYAERVNVSHPDVSRRQVARVDVTAGMEVRCESMLK